MSAARSQRCCAHRTGRNRKMETNGNLFEGEVAFGPGGASGIGRAAALAFARQGASVVVADVSDEGNQETARLIEQEGGRALAVRCDVRCGEEVKAALDTVARRCSKRYCSINQRR